MAWVAQIDRVTLKALDGFGDVHTANGGSDYVLHIINIEAVTGGCFAVDIHGDIAPPCNTLSIGRSSAGNC